MGTGKPSSCATNFAVVERDGVLWIWRGHVLTADASKLPRYPAAEQSLTVDTTLDYDCDWTHVMESNLASPDLTMGETAPAAATSARFNAPNVVHHQRSEGAFTRRCMLCRSRRNELASCSGNSFERKVPF